MAMATKLEQGFYRDAELGLFLVTDTGELWLVENGGDVDLPRRVDGDLTATLVPSSCVRAEHAAEFRQMVEEASASAAGLTWRQRPSLLH